MEWSIFNKVENDAVTGLDLMLFHAVIMNKNVYTNYVLRLSFTELWGKLCGNRL